MKLTAATAVTVVLALFASATFAAETNSSRPSGLLGGKGKESKPDPAALVAHLNDAFVQIAPFDLNINGQLEESELALLADAIEAGMVIMTPPPGRTPPAGFSPPAERIAERAAGMYASVAIYDADANGILSADELAALKTAIESGKLSRPGQGGRGRPGAQ